MTETPRPVTATRPSVPPAISAAIARAFMKAPADRFESTAAFARAITSPSVTGAAMRGDAAAARIDDALAQSIGSLPWVKVRPAATARSSGCGSSMPRRAP